MDHIKEIVSENIRLIKELEQQIKDSIVAVATTEGNELRVVSFVISNEVSPFHRGYEVFGKFELNGKDYEIKFTLPSHEFNVDNHTYILDKICNKIAESLAAEIFKMQPIKMKVHETFFAIRK